MSKKKRTDIDAALDAMDAAHKAAPLTEKPQLAGDKPPKPEEKPPKPTKAEKRKEKLTTARKAKIKTFLKAHSHKATTVDAATFSDTDELIDLLCSLHGIDRKAQYEPATA